MSTKLSLRQKDNIQNMGIGGWLIRKTVQPNSLRHVVLEPSDYRDKNMVLYLNKKFSEVRQRMGSAKIPNQLLSSACIRLKSKKKQLEDLEREAKEKVNDDEVEEKPLVAKPGKTDEEKTIVEMIGPLSRKILKEMKDKEVRDDFVVVAGGGVEKKDDKKVSINPEKKLASTVSSLISEGDLRELFTKYNRVRLREKMNQFRNDPNFTGLHFHNKLKFISQNLKKQDDPAESYVFMTEVSRSQNVNLGTLLNIDMNDVKLRHEQEDEAEAYRHGKMKGNKLSEEELQALIEEDDEYQNKKLVEIFKETHMENLDLDTQKNRLTKATMNKQQQNQEKMFKSMNQHHKEQILKLIRNKSEVNPQRFVRNLNIDYSKHNKLRDNIFLRLYGAPGGEENGQENETNSLRPKSSPFVNGLKKSDSMLSFSQSPTANYLRKPHSAVTHKRSHASSIRSLRFSHDTTQAPATPLMEPNMRISLLKSASSMQMLTDKQKRKRQRMLNMMETRQTQKNFQDFLNNCEDGTSSNNQLSKEIGSDLNTLDVQFSMVINRLRSKQVVQDETKKLLDFEFNEFKQQRNFKRQFVNHMIENITDKREVLNKYSRLLQREAFLSNSDQK